MQPETFKKDLTVAANGKTCNFNKHSYTSGKTWPNGDPIVLNRGCYPLDEGFTGNYVDFNKDTHPVRKSATPSVNIVDDAGTCQNVHDTQCTRFWGEKVERTSGCLD
jgi:hypothetical protein